MKRLKNLVKYNKVFLSIYRFFGNCLICILKVFTKINQKKILFMSFGGQKYDDSPRALYEAMIQDKYFNDFQIVWAFTDPKKMKLECKVVKIDTLAFYISALTSKYWINNSSVERGLKLRRNGTFELNTWHGTPLKKMGSDIQNYSGYDDQNKKETKHCIYCSQSQYDKDIWVRFFNTSPDNIFITDLPRNDCLANHNDSEISLIKEKLNIPLNKKIILYAPTFREYWRDKDSGCVLNNPLNFELLKEKLGNEYFVLFRAHYEIAHILGITNNDFVKDVSNYEYLNELMIVSDILISDYSSIFFDYSILEKPMICFAYDYEEYKLKRGLYASFNDLPSKICKTQEELISELIGMDEAVKIEQTITFKNKYAPVAGNSCNMVLSLLKKQIDKEKRM